MRFTVHRTSAKRSALLAVALGALTLGCGSSDADATPPGQTVVDNSEYTSGYKGGLPGFGTVMGSTTATYEYVIPLGAGDALDAGTPLTILPGELTATIGQTIKIVNNDRRGHNVGPWFVGANETVRQEFTSEGKYEGLCTVHPSGAFVLHVIG